MAKKIILGLLTAILAILFFPQPAKSQTIKIYIAGSSAMLKNTLTEEEKDCRVEKLRAFLESYNSPLAKYAEDFVKIADQHGLDWRLIPAITGVESTFGRQIPYRSFNAYGWVNGEYRFDSWEQSIEIVAKTLKEKYLDRGLETPVEIGPVYAPPSPAWGIKVNAFMEKIDSFQVNDCLSLLSLTI